MYTSPFSLVLGFHGCDREVGEQVLCGAETHLRGSENQYDWLGHGIYFWENNPARALEFVRERQRNPRRHKAPIKEPYVIGAVIDPGNCLNLLESSALDLVAQSYQHLADISASSELALPENKADRKSGELLQRFLDCAVMETLHELNGSNPFDTVRGMFAEGPELYPNAGFRARNHIQLCIRNSTCIKGYFRLLPES